MSDAQDKQIRIAAVLGTARPGNFTSKALALILAYPVNAHDRYM